MMPYCNLRSALLVAALTVLAALPAGASAQQVRDSVIVTEDSRVQRIADRKALRRKMKKLTKKEIQMIYPIVIYGDDVLRRKCAPIAPEYPAFKKLVEDMFATLAVAEGVGLAAPQIGKDIRLFIVDCTPWADEDPSCVDYKRAFINPEIYAYSEQKRTYNEGCLSFPGLRADVPRSLGIRMRYLDEDFKEHDEEFTGLKAWVIQHEYDHIEGVVFTDRISALRRNLIKGKLLNLSKGKYSCDYKTK